MFCSKLKNGQKFDVTKLRLHCISDIFGSTFLTNFVIAFVYDFDVIGQFFYKNLFKHFKEISLRVWDVGFGRQEFLI